MATEWVSLFCFKILAKPKAKSFIYVKIISERIIKLKDGIVTKIKTVDAKRNCGLPSILDLVPDFCFTVLMTTLYLKITIGTIWMLSYLSLL